MSEELTTTALKEEEFNKKVDMKVWKRCLLTDCVKKNC